jgi:hypothetical protein
MRVCINTVPMAPAAGTYHTGETLDAGTMAPRLTRLITGLGADHQLGAHPLGEILLGQVPQ